MDQVELKGRTKKFALRIIRLVEALPNGRLCDILPELLAASQTIESSRLKNLEKEANELLSITVSSIKTARSNSQSRILKRQKK